MKKKLILLTIILFGFLLPLTAAADTENKLVISRLVNGTWIDVSVTDQSYLVNSTNLLYQGDLLSYIWDQIATLTDSINFYQLTPSSGNYTLSITISTTHGTNTIYLIPELEDYTPEFGKFVNYFMSLSYRLTGAYLKLKAWPLDIQVVYTKCIPQKYSISTIIQREPDFLTYVMEGNATLVVGDIGTNVYDLQWISNANYVQTAPVSIASGGRSQRIDFELFELPESLNASNLGFAVIYEAALISSRSIQPQLLSTNVSIPETAIPTHQTLPLILPISPIFLVALLLLRSKAAKPLNGK